MHQLGSLFRHQLRLGLRLPADIRQEFLQESVRKNDFSMRIICAIIFAVEIFNLVRVVFLSRSGLGTWNNRFYFAMYCVLLGVAAVWLALRRTLQRAPVCVQWGAQYTVTVLILVWHIGLNAYDLYRDPAAGTTVLTTALLALAMFIQLPPWCSVVQFAASYLLFRAVMAPLLDAGSRLNLTITFVVSLTVSLALAYHTTVALRQNKQIMEINTKLQELVQRDPLTGLLNKTTVECWADQVLQGLGQTGRIGGLALFLVDLDKFKQVNDRYGHPCGDHVLVETAEAMRCVFPDAAGLGRIGGDEFAVLYDRPMTVTQAVALGQRLVEQLGTVAWQGQPLGVRCSVGVCICTRPNYSYQQLYTETDQMLYRAKETGRGRCCVRQLVPAGQRQCEEGLV